MKAFTIENESNNITLHTTLAAAKAVSEAEHFRDEAGLAKLAADWPMPRLVEIWNSLPGVAPVKKFTDRKTAAARIWKAIQSLAESVPAKLTAEEPEQVPDEAIVIEVATEAVPEVPPASPAQPALDTNVAPQSPDVAPQPVPSKTKATRERKATSTPATKKTREGSKTEAILALMRQPGGTTLKAIMEATTWQAHSVRGFISGTLNKKMGLTVISAKGESGERTYSIRA